MFVSVDKSRAGKGPIDVKVQSARSKPQVFISEVRSDVFRATFTPVETGSHDVHVLFNKVNVLDSPFQCHIFDMDDIDINWDDLDDVPVFEQARLDIDANDVPVDEFDVTLKDPYNLDLPVRLTNHSHGRFSLEFEPQNVGRHLLTIAHDDKQVPGSPHEFNVYDATRAVIREVSSPALLHRPATFMGKVHVQLAVDVNFCFNLHRS